jgi:mRNA interferase RelE/StbE
VKRYAPSLERRVLKQLERLPDDARERVISAIQGLEDNPRPPGYRKLKARMGCRIRVGDYRVIYEIDDEQLALLVMTVLHRKDVYRKK